MRRPALVVWILCVGCGGDMRHAAPEGRDADVVRTRGAPSAAEWLAGAATAHAAADLAIDRGDRAGAQRTLVELLAVPVPRTLAAADREAVLADIYFRLACVTVDQGVPAESLAWAERGLDLGRSEDALTFNLLLARARAHEGLGRKADASRDLAAAKRVHEALVTGR